MSKRVKRLMVRDLAGELGTTDSCVVVGVGPLDVATTTNLRSELRQKGLRLRVLKNRVASHALREVGWGGVDGLLDGSSAVAFGEGGAITASKCLVDWERKVPEGALRILGGYMDGKVLGVDQVRQLATIPDRPTLYAMLASLVVQPIGQVVGLLNELIAGVARAVGAVAEKKQGND